MARTGWCRECGEWVSVKEDLECPNGHGPECVDAVHQDAGTMDATGMSKGFGVGEMPAGAHRFNWGAFLLTPLWGVVYGSVTVLAWWVAALFAALTLSSFVSPTSTAANLALAASAAAIVEIGIRLWVGMNANRWLWSREGRRLELIEGASPRFSVATFLGKQFKWLVVGGSLTVLSVAGLALLALSDGPQAVAMREELTITPLQVGTSAVWTFAEVALAAWLSMQMRRESERATPSAQG